MSYTGTLPARTNSLEAGSNALGLREGSEEGADVVALSVRPTEVVGTPGLTLITIDNP